MFLRLFSIEWTRVSRRPLLWLAWAACILYIGLGISRYYTLGRTDLLNGTLRMPGAAFDLANALDQLLVAIPLLLILAAILMGDDYSQRTNQHWLMHAPRSTSLLAKFAVLVFVTLVTQVIALFAGALVGFYYKTYIYGVPDLPNVDWLAAAAAPLYMTLVNLPYLALALALSVLLRSALFGAMLGLGYGQFLDLLMSGIFHGAGWTRWLFTNVHFSASFLLNAIGSRSVDPPAHILAPAAALVTAAAYTLTLLAFAIWLYRRQNLSG